MIQWFNLRSLAFVGLLIGAGACGKGPAGEPILPANPSSGATTGAGGAGGMDQGTANASTTGAGGQGGTAMPDPNSQWTEFGPSHDLLPELQVIGPDEVYAVASDPIQVGDVIALWNGATWSSMTDGAGGLRNAFHYIAPLDPLLDPVQFVAVVSNRMELWDGLDWNIITADALGLHAGLQYLDIDNIYAPVGEQIQMWDGILNAWAPISDDVPAPFKMTRAFHWVSDIEIYAMLENGPESEIMLWDGAIWQPLAAAAVDLKPEMHFVSPTEIYAIIGTGISVWNGTMWSTWTDDVAGLKTAFSFKGPDDIYAVVGLDRVWRWGP